MALARGRILHARFLERRFAGELRPGCVILGSLSCSKRRCGCSSELGDGRGQGEALFLIGCFHQVVMDDGETAVPFFDRSVAASAAVGDQMTVSYSQRHLGFAELEAGRLDAALDWFERSTLLRREAGFLPGVAANLVAMAEVAVAKGERDEALRLLDEAIEIGNGCGAARMVELAERTKADLAAGAG